MHPIKHEPSLIKTLYAGERYNPSLVYIHVYVYISSRAAFHLPFFHVNSHRAQARAYLPSSQQLIVITGKTIQLACFNATVHSPLFLSCLSFFPQYTDIGTSSPPPSLSFIITTCNLFFRPCREGISIRSE